MCKIIWKPCKMIFREFTDDEIDKVEYAKWVESWYKANEEYEIPEELKEIIKSLGDK